MSHVITYAPSASSLGFLRNQALYTPSRDSTMPRLLAIGNPQAMSHQEPGEISRTPLYSLPKAEIKTAYAVSLLDGVLLQREHATLASFQEKLQAQMSGQGEKHGRSIIHFATHCASAKENPMHSSFCLANGQSISAYVLIGQHLPPTDLVVISGCSSGYTRATNGDNTLGLLHGLLGAGARAVLVSLWPVDDAAATVLTGEFHRALLRGEDMAKALRGAQEAFCSLDARQLWDKLGNMQGVKHGSGRGRGEVFERGSSRSYVREECRRERQLGHPYYWALCVLIAGCLFWSKNSDWLSILQERK